MKKLIIFILILGILVFPGCKSSNSSKNDTNLLLLFFLLFQANNTASNTRTISGTIKYEFPEYQSGSGLNWSSPSKTEKNCRQIRVELISGSTVLASSNTDDNGAYSISVPSSVSSSQYLQVRAVSRIMANTVNTNFKSNDTTNNVLVEVLDNYNSKNVHSSSSSSFQLTSSSATVNLVIPAENATTRSATVNKAGAFSILDTSLSAYKKLAAADTSLTFSKLKIFWSVYNIASASNNPPSGQISTSFYGTVSAFDSARSLYILGYADNDTDEFDVGVIAHEFGHYTEDTIFRSDSIGGSHSGSNRLDPRLAFGEGFGNGISSIFRDDPTYHDTLGTNAATTGVNMNMESNVTSDGGVWSETSVQAILWDLYDSTTSGDSNDSLTLSFSDLYNVMKNYQKTTPAMTTLISFLYSLKQALPANATAIDNIANMSGVGSATSVYDISDIAVGTTEPTCRTAIYQDLTLGSSLTNQALNEDPGSSTAGKNKYCATKYYKITGNGSSKTITMAPTGCDADIYLYKNGSIIAYDNDGGSGVSESITYTLENNVVYILDVRLYSGTSCTFTVSTN